MNSESQRQSMAKGLKPLSFQKEASQTCIKEWYEDRTILKKNCKFFGSQLLTYLEIEKEVKRLFKNY